MLPASNRTSQNALHLFSLLAACGVAALPSLAQSTPAPTTQPDNPLAGPSVDATTKATLVKRDFEGKLERLDARPEAAAAELLTLTPDQRTLISEILQRRTADVQRITEENLELFLKLQGARQGGDRKEAMSLMRDFRVVAEPLLKPSLFNQIRDVLPQDQRAEYARLVDEYLEALAAEPDPMGKGLQRGEQRGERGGDRGSDRAKKPDATAEPKSDDPMRLDDATREDAPARAGTIARRRVEMNLLVREIARNFGQMVEERRERTDEMLKAINATEEQEAKIRAIIRAGTENGAKPTADQRAERFQKIMKELTPEQRRSLMDWQRGSRPDAKSE